MSWSHDLLCNHVTLQEYTDDNDAAEDEVLANEVVSMP